MSKETTPKLGAFEIAKDITTEQMAAVFFDKNALREPNYRLCQLNARGQRYYYSTNDNGTTLYPSVTTILKKVMPENKFLTDWKVDLGKEAAEAYTMDRARFGSFVHGQLQELVVTRKYDLDKIGERLAEYVQRNNLPISFMEHEEEARYDMLSFAKWMRDYEVRPLAVEISLYHPELGFAGMIDLVCSMKVYPTGDKKDNGERVVAICDFKTTTKDFHDEHAIQLGLYKLMWDNTFPDMRIEALANVSPKAWWNTVKKQVSYQFEWQTENEVLQQIPYLLELYKLLPRETKRIPLCGGVIDLTEDVEKNVEVLTLEELIDKSRNEEEEEPKPLFEEE